jgi:hypothetical protein
MKNVLLNRVFISSLMCVTYLILLGSINNMMLRKEPYSCEEGANHILKTFQDANEKLKHFSDNFEKHRELYDDLDRVRKDIKAVTNLHDSDEEPQSTVDIIKFQISQIRRYITEVMDEVQKASNECTQKILDKGHETLSRLNELEKTVNEPTK